MSGIGCPRYFDVEKYLDCVEGMIMADEVESAFKMLDLMPAYYRDNEPERAKEIRSTLSRQLFTAVQYKGIYDALNEDAATAYWPGRAQVTEELVRGLGGAHILELAPGSFFLPLGLRKRGVSFTYRWLGLDDKGPALPDTRIPGQKVIFCCFELIEHLNNEFEIYQNYLKFNEQADYVLLSTPLYTYAGGMAGWRDRPLGHLRTYSPVSFLTKAKELFPGFEWQIFADDTIILKGARC